MIYFVEAVLGGCFRPWSSFKAPRNQGVASPQGGDRLPPRHPALTHSVQHLLQSTQSQVLCQVRHYSESDLSSINCYILMTATSQYLSEQYAVRKCWVQQILKMFGLSADNDIRDCFASSSNRRFNKFWTVHDNALEQDWNNSEIKWCNPPWSIWPATAQKILTSYCQAIAVFPAWHSKQWVQDLLFAGSKVAYFEIGSKIFQLDKPVGGIRWGLYVVLIGPNHPMQVAAEPGGWSAAARRRWRRKLRKQASC
jgi:hypothetical protein